jgi:tRNA modification GTPase
MDQTSDSSTIAAVSSAPGYGGIAIVRLSGPDTEEIISKIFKPDQAGFPLESHKLHLGWIGDPRTGSRVDQVLCSFMRGPHTYTREDVAEINTHGGPVITQRILHLALSMGARLADPGEFTRRAFLAGRIDLSQAEAVAELIAARSQAEAELAASQLGGGLRKQVEGFRQTLIDILAHLEVALDFPDEEAEIIQESEAAQKIRTSVLIPLEELLEAYEAGRFYREGLQVAIIGRSNVGKSSLLNRLLETDRAIVTDLPGTTRDIIEAEALIDGIPLTLVDTAGLESEARDEAEAEGQRRAEARLNQADLILLVLDRNRPLSSEDSRILDYSRVRPAIILLNKSDLAPAFGADEVKNQSNSCPVLVVSAKTGHGISELKASIIESVTGGRTKTDHIPAIVPNTRHKRALEEARQSLLPGIKALDEGLPPEIVALEIRTALDHLGVITGQTTTEDILDRIFQDFCLGK